jgi:hypothetical protein
MIKQGLIAHVTREHDFENELYWYRFADSEAERGKDIEVRYQPFLTLNFLRDNPHGTKPYLP